MCVWWVSGGGLTEIEGVIHMMAEGQGWIGFQTRVMFWATLRVMNTHKPCRAVEIVSHRRSTSKSSVLSPWVGRA